MCGRFVLISSAEALASAFGIEDPPALAPRYNIAPGQPVLTVHQDPAGRRRGGLIHWGLVPAWSRERPAGASLINARAETAADKPSFRLPFRRRRCVVPADGFYEWSPAGAARQPWFIHRRDRRPFAIAGLWDRWYDPGGNALESCALLTTAANSFMAPLHSRMPVILDAETIGPWLDPDEHRVEHLAMLLKPVPDDLLAAYAVNRRVNDPRHDDPACLEPAPSECH